MLVEAGLGLELLGGAGVGLVGEDVGLGVRERGGGYLAIGVVVGAVADGAVGVEVVGFGHVVWVLFFLSEAWRTFRLHKN